MDSDVMFDFFDILDIDDRRNELKACKKQKTRILKAGKLAPSIEKSIKRLEFLMKKKFQRYSTIYFYKFLNHAKVSKTTKFCFSRLYKCFEKLQRTKMKLFFECIKLESKIGKFPKQKDFKIAKACCKVSEDNDSFLYGTNFNHQLSNHNSKNYIANDRVLQDNYKKAMLKQLNIRLNIRITEIFKRCFNSFKYIIKRNLIENSIKKEQEQQKAFTNCFRSKELKTKDLPFYQDEQKHKNCVLKLFSHVIKKYETQYQSFAYFMLKHTYLVATALEESQNPKCSNRRISRSEQESKNKGITELKTSKIYIKKAFSCKLIPKIHREDHARKEKLSKLIFHILMKKRKRSLEIHFQTFKSVIQPLNESAISNIYLSTALQVLGLFTGEL